MFAAATAVLFFAGCEPLPASDDRNPLAIDLEGRLLELEEKTADLKMRLDFWTKWEEYNEEGRQFAWLSPGSQGYVPIEMANRHGPIIVSLKDIEPYANGSRVTVELGNVLGVDISSFSFVVEWGAVHESIRPGLVNYVRHGRVHEDQKEHVDYRRAKKVESTQTLRRGAWTKVQIVPEEVPPSGLEVVRLGNLNPEIVSLTVS
jgi:hypothetical protein